MMPGVCNFQASFMTWDKPHNPNVPRPYARHNTPLGNSARIQLEALLDVTDNATGETERFFLIAPCRAEWVYAEDQLFQIPSREDPDSEWRILARLSSPTYHQTFSPIGT